MRTPEDQNRIDTEIQTVIQNGYTYYEVGLKQFISRKEAEHYVVKLIANQYRDQRRQDNK